MPPVSPISSVPPVYTPPTPEQVSRATNTQLNAAPIPNQAQTVAAQAQPPLGLQAPQVLNAPAQQPSIDLVQQSVAQRAAEAREAALLRDQSIQSLQQELDPVTTPQEQIDALNTARLQNGQETAQQLTEFNRAQVRLGTVELAQEQLQNQLNALNDAQNQPDPLDPLGLNQEPLGLDPTNAQDQQVQAQRDAEAAQEARAEEQRIVEEQVAEAAEERRIVEEQNTEAVLEQQDLQRAEAERLQQERDATEVVEVQDAQRAEELRLQAQEQAATIEAQREAEQVAAQQDAQRVQAQRLEDQQLDEVTDRAERAQEVQDEVRMDTDRAAADRALDAYRIQSERAAETAGARAEAALPLNDQLQAARARLDAVDDTAIDRVDLSNSALVGLAGQ